MSDHDSSVSRANNFTAQAESCKCRFPPENVVLPQPSLAASIIFPHTKWLPKITDYRDTAALSCEIQAVLWVDFQQASVRWKHWRFANTGRFLRRIANTLRHLRSWPHLILLYVLAKLWRSWMAEFLITVRIGYRATGYNDLPAIMIGLKKIKTKTSKRHSKYHYIQCILTEVIYRIKQRDLKNQTMKFWTKNITYNDS